MSRRLPPTSVEQASSSSRFRMGRSSRRCLPGWCSPGVDRFTDLVDVAGATHRRTHSANVVLHHTLRSNDLGTKGWAAEVLVEQPVEQRCRVCSRHSRLARCHLPASALRRHASASEHHPSDFSERHDEVHAERCVQTHCQHRQDQANDTIAIAYPIGTATSVRCVPFGCPPPSSSSCCV